MSHTDIKREGFIAKLPRCFQPYAVLMRLDRPIGWWLLLFPGWWAILLSVAWNLRADSFVAYGWLIYNATLFFIGAILMRGAGCVINDLWDRDLDAKVERTKTRPLASGEVKIWQAAIFLFSLLMVSLIILLQMPWTTIKLGFLAIIPVILYPYMKRITWWPQLFLGITFNFGVLMGWSAMTGDLSLPPLILYLACIFWTLGYDTIYAHQDKDDDALIGIKSTARLFGNNSKIWVSIFYTVFFLLLCLATILSAAYIWAPLFFMPAGIHLIWQIFTWDMHNPKSSLSIFKSNCTFGFLVIGGIFCAAYVPPSIIGLFML